MARGIWAWAAVAAVLAASVAGVSAIGQSAQQAKSLTLYAGEGFQGKSFRITGDTADLDRARHNDFAMSIRTEGRWLVCEDAKYAGRCVEIDGNVTDLRPILLAMAVSSVRYVGSSYRVAGNGGTSTQPAQPASTWQPMHNTDLFGGDYREIVYDRPGSGWQQCKAACDGDSQCRAFTYVVPGRNPHGECFLKNSVPQPSPSECCISGVKGAPSTLGRTGSAPPVPGALRRVGERAGDAVERGIGDRVQDGVGKALGRAF